MRAEKLYKNFPETPGVYIMKSAKGEILYIGKAGNLKRRVSSYFQRPHDSRIQKLVSLIAKISYKKTDTALEALILEADLIKKYEPPFNIREKDDTSFLYVEITDELFPRVLLVRGKDLIKRRLAPSLTEYSKFSRSAHKREERNIRFSAGYGPFTSAGSIREALRILRKIFPWSTHIVDSKTFSARPCFDYQIGLCPGTCIGALSKSEYAKTIKNLKLLFEGKKNKVIENLKKEMHAASRNLEFERAAKLWGQIFALQHIQDVALISDDEVKGFNSKVSKFRIEGYDVSNISGTSAVGSMVVFTGGAPDKNEYRKFKIQTLSEPNPASPLAQQGGDVGMLREMLARRFGRAAQKGGWALPDLILIDGGKSQVHVAEAVLQEYGLKIPVVGIAKGKTRKKNEFIGSVPKGTTKEILIRVRNEAHRFAITYHKVVRKRTFYN